MESKTLLIPKFQTRKGSYIPVVNRNKISQKDVSEKLTIVKMKMTNVQINVWDFFRITKRKTPLKVKVTNIKIKVWETFRITERMTRSKENMLLLIEGRT